MFRVIALTQFVFVSLGTMALMILMKTQKDHAGLAHELREFMSRRGLWMLLIPIVWIVFAELIQAATSDTRVLKGLQASGVFIAALVFALYGWLVLSF